MSFSKVYSAQTNLLRGHLVTIEIDITPNTLHNFTVVGLPDKAVEESKDRMSSALKNSGCPSPKNLNQKIVISLSPADLKKEGPYFDLAIALAYLLSIQKINFNPEGKLFLGELSLNGDLRAIKGALPLTEEAKKLGFKEIFLPEVNASEAALVEGITVYGVKNLKEIIEHLNLIKKEGLENPPDEKPFKIEPTPLTQIKPSIKDKYLDFSDIKGQEMAKRGLEIAASGGHNLAMSGPPGTGKTMLARAFTQLLPDLSKEECLEITGIHSVMGLLEDHLVTNPPFRSPHHTASYVSMIGGGINLKPGEVTLAHRGVLFLDEFPEFEKRVLESLRQPLEDHFVSISRAKGSAIFPSNFILIAAMNPCPCGYKGSKVKNCICKPSDLHRYHRKISGPIMDRIDMWVTVGEVDFYKLSEVESKEESSDSIKERVLHARQKQRERFRENKRKISTNSQMNVKELNLFAPLNQKTREILNESAKKLQLSARAYHRTIKLARTIADLENSENILPQHILEALQYRPRDNSL